MDLSNYIQDRDEAFSSADPDKVKAYCKKYEIAIPEDETIFLAGMHKAICDLFRRNNNSISIEQYNKSYDWLVKNNYSPEIIGGDK